MSIISIFIIYNLLSCREELEDMINIKKKSFEETKLLERKEYEKSEVSLNDFKNVENLIKNDKRQFYKSIVSDNFNTAQQNRTNKYKYRNQPQLGFYNQNDSIDYFKNPEDDQKMVLEKKLKLKQIAEIEREMLNNKREVYYKDTFIL